MKILSLDLDWFNTLAPSQIEGICVKIASSCKLPPTIDFVREHHYLYPWVLPIMQGCKSEDVEVVNIDEHHDFYCAYEIERSDRVTCGNFFAWMLSEGILSKYSWVTNCASTAQVKCAEEGLQAEAETVTSNLLDSFSNFICNSVSTHKRSDVIELLAGQIFDGFLVCESRHYTSDLKRIREKVSNCFVQCGFSVADHDNTDGHFNHSDINSISEALFT